MKHYLIGKMIYGLLFVFSGLSGLGSGFEISFPKNTDFMHPFAAGSLYLFCAIL
jgi:hypothetical protein